MDIPTEHLNIEIYPPRENKGGQHVGYTSSGVKVTHLPSGIIAIVTNGRSQHINRMVALDMIVSAITHPNYRL